MFPYTEFLPVTLADLQKKGVSQADFVIISGDAYVDHPSFAAAIIGRVLEKAGFSVAILAQPDCKNPLAFKIFGEPKYAFLVTSGNLDSMVNHYTANKKPRSEDAYSPGGKSGKRPDRALIAYCNALRAAYKGASIIIGGIEASLRRFSHYDYWSDTVKRSILLDTKADLLVYGMGERAIVEIANELKNGLTLKEIQNIQGTMYRTGKEPSAIIEKGVLLPSFEEIVKDKILFSKSFMTMNKYSGAISGKVLIEQSGASYVVQNPPQSPLSQKELDLIYELPFTRSYHPSYEKEGGIPALEEIQFSLVSSRGCFGACSFCALAFHQGRIIQARSKASLVREAELLTKHPDFKGYIHDVGGPTANFRTKACKNQSIRGACTDKQCLHPEPCSQLEVDHSDFLEVLKAIRNLPGVKKVFVRSGIRFDYLLLENSDEFLRELIEHHISGQLKIAPEHVSEKVLAAMGKPKPQVYIDFAKKYQRLNEELEKKQFIIPYFISAHPGSSLVEAIELAEYLRDTGFTPDQVQDFYPTPGTIASCMYYTELDPRTLEPIYVAKGARERSMQRALLQYKKPENYALVKEALILAGRKDLIGYSKKSLIR